MKINFQLVMLTSETFEKGTDIDVALISCLFVILEQTEGITFSKK